MRAYHMPTGVGYWAQHSEQGRGPSLTHTELCPPGQEGLGCQAQSYDQYKLREPQAWAPPAWKPRGPWTSTRGLLHPASGGEEECPQNLALGMTTCHPALLPHLVLGPSLTGMGLSPSAPGEGTTGTKQTVHGPQ